MSSSKPGDASRNGTCHTAANTSPTTITRCGKLGVEKNSRIASRYETPATPRGMMKGNSPGVLSLREQIVSATSRMAPSPYTLTDGVSFTVLSCSSATVRPFAPTLSATPRSVEHVAERAAGPRRVALGRRPRRYRRKDQ